MIRWISHRNGPYRRGRAADADLPRHDRERTRRLVDQREEAHQVDLAAVDLEIVAHQRVLDASGAGHHLDEDRLGQRQRRVGIGLYWNYYIDRVKCESQAIFR